MQDAARDESARATTFTAAPIRDIDRRHLERSASVVRIAVGHAQKAMQVQSEAARKLDAAEYALHRMLDELSDVMTAPIKAPALQVVPRLPTLPTTAPALAA